ncbi:MULTISPECIES: hypothetical protein [unclassified Rhodococcus (in: high G+C Gram-positive bacteria)]|uniref:hypothetical protein n=1 Tax=unclassified Rhodococcus (in: high G+C Gram-positive bacteria) TaxID=192944 RepID=UPI0015E89AC2|nr:MULTISPECIES: hypothetical protein [unclassified Rhodococcus (in: high G+C Gram-positive bacteria)]
MQQGDHVRIGTGGVSVFTIVSVDDDAHTAIIESSVDAPGKYPFPVKLANLVPVT